MEFVFSFLQLVIGRNSGDRISKQNGLSVEGRCTHEQNTQTRWFLCSSNLDTDLKINDILKM